MDIIENVVKSLRYAKEHEQGLYLTHEETPALIDLIYALASQVDVLKEINVQLAEFCIRLYLKPLSSEMNPGKAKVTNVQKNLDKDLQVW